VHEEERAEQLFLVVEAAVQARLEWGDSDTPYITEKLELAVDDLVESFATGMIPGGCRALAATVGEMAAVWRDWRARADASGLATAMPGNGFWRLFDMVGQMVADAQPAEPKPLEPIAVLRDQKVSDAQIARIYGFVDRRGSPMPWKVQEELNEPGRHTGPGTGWVAPIHRKRAEEATRRAEAVERARAAGDRKIQRASAPPPESLAELIGQGVGLAQLCKILRKTRGEVAALCEAQGLPIPPEQENLANFVPPTQPEHVTEQAQRYARTAEAGRAARTARPRTREIHLEHAPAEPDPDPSGDQAGGEAEGGDGEGEGEEPESTLRSGLTVEQQIVELHCGGLSPAQIVKDLRGEPGAPSIQKVTAVVKRYSQDPEAFALPAG
jgi:hypothetical protein